MTSPSSPRGAKASSGQMEFPRLVPNTPTTATIFKIVHPPRIHVKGGWWRASVWGSPLMCGRRQGSKTLATRLDALPVLLMSLYANRAESGATRLHLRTRHKSSTSACSSKDLPLRIEPDGHRPRRRAHPPRPAHTASSELSRIGVHRSPHASSLTETRAD